MPKITVLLAATLVAAGLSACSATTDSADLGPLQIRHTAVGAVLTDQHGMTLYTFKNDPRGGSACYDRCARKWTPMEAPAGMEATGNLSVIERKDGIRQLAYDGKALYHWEKDKAPGDTKGHDLGDVWYSARP